PMLPTGIDQWRQTLDYGFPAARSTSATGAGVGISGHSCVTDAGYIYCIGGLERTNRLVSSGTGPLTVSEPFDTPTTKVLYAPLSSAGVGDWHTTSDYGERVFGHSCVAMNRHIY